MQVNEGFIVGVYNYSTAGASDVRSRVDAVCLPIAPRTSSSGITAPSANRVWSERHGKFGRRWSGGRRSRRRLL
jgi:hypothetical protein